MLFVKDLAKQCQTTTDAVRYYTKLGLLKPKRNRSNNYKMYDRNDAIRLNFIRRAKTLGFTLNEIKEILRASEKRQSPCPMVRDMISARITQNKTHMRETMALQQRMEAASRQWQAQPDALPIGDSICYLIEQSTS